MFREAGVQGLVERLINGDKRALARTISRVETGGEDVPELVRGLYPYTGGAFSVGFTGPPGVGKSSVIAELIRIYRAEGMEVGVISVDPSSPFSRGAILGDRIRLADHFLDSGVFIRSMGSRGHLGGLAAASKLGALAMEAYGVDVVLYETVGVGQGEVEVASVADTVVLALQPGSGDAVQALKAGVMEVADVICVNKSDHPQAKAAAREARQALEIGHELDPESPLPEIVMTRGDAGEGVEELRRAVDDHRGHLTESGGLERRRMGSIQEFMLSWTRAKLEDRMRQRLDRQDEDLVNKVYRRELDPISAAETLYREV
ncbi:methylmalonyl Co-A mutase-associated GTPase MeaB [Rubrobacter aplysinae]|uniref:methylmalonyl Co-A mutase-associated GTPase MeaB n=1 Tax=Rubrobacter aplysinae TaxID=909625 RepID=UPI00064BF4EA|nr:methylmalonyl Co-A mutase-associated GTPase MeaB [Rubrobacter aplysinae]